LGTFSPVLRFSARVAQHRPIIDFLNQHLERSRKNAVDAKLALLTSAEREAHVETEFNVAAFVVPELDSSLYTFGSSIIGYDIRRRSPIRVANRSEVGEAQLYGFHLTVCDVLYFLNNRDVERAIAEMSFRADELPIFDLTNLTIQKGFPDESSI